MSFVDVHVPVDTIEQLNCRGSTVRQRQRYAVFSRALDRLVYYFEDVSDDCKRFGWRHPLEFLAQCERDEPDVPRVAALVGRALAKPILPLSIGG